MSGPAFPAAIRREVRNFKTGASYFLLRADAVAATDENVAAIVAICNQPAVYDFLFRKRLDGAPYPEESARGFLEWAAAGWRDATHFVFLVTTAQGLPVAAIDIKSPDPGEGEVGYWCSAAHHGLMTNTLAALREIAVDAGYTGLIAFAKPDNARSQQVLLRNGFARDTALEATRENRRAFRLQLPARPRHGD